MTKVHAVIPAAGRGARFGSELNKILHALDGRTVIQRTVDALSPFVDTTTIVANSLDYAVLKSLFTDIRVRIVVGAQTRQDSVWNGLESISDNDGIVLVHDGARPLVSGEVIERCITSVRNYGSGVAGIPVVDALKRADGRSNTSNVVLEDVERDGLWAVQTPQAFQISLLREAHISANSASFFGKDEASLVQRLIGSQVHLVYGDRRNIKITTQSDLVLAEQLLRGRSRSETRVGIGYDIHRLVDGRQLWLGGVEIPSQLGLDGHSDADVLLHAVCDSLLGAAGLLDIGHYFPNTDQQYRNISSLILLNRVYDILQEHRWSVGNVDTMLIAERPRIGPYIQQMKLNISDVLNVDADRISIKATTNERIGSLGSGDGIACHASAAIFR